MPSSSYLVSLALLEQADNRLMPIGGKALNSKTTSIEGDWKEGKQIALELLLRVFQRSEQGMLRRQAAGESLLLVELPMEELQVKLPSLKLEWITTGDTSKFISELKCFSRKIWIIDYIKYEGIIFKSIH